MDSTATTGLMLVFRLTPSGESRLHLVGDILPFGNRDFQFGTDGELVRTGTGTCGVFEEQEENPTGYFQVHLRWFLPSGNTLLRKFP